MSNNSIREDIALKLLELTKSNKVQWCYHGSTVYANSILKDSDQYACNVSGIDSEISLIISDDDSVLVVDDILISNVSVRRLRNWIEFANVDIVNTEQARLDSIYALLNQL